MTKKTLFIHIGHYKTGTSALQTAIMSNRRALARLGVDYCRVERRDKKHSSLAFCLLRAAGTWSLMHGYADDASPESLWDQVFEYAAHSAQDKILISSEELARLGANPQASALLKQQLARGHRDLTIKVIVYLRPPGEQLRSWYNQLVKMGIKTPDFNNAVPRFIEPVHFDYDCLLRPWIDACGPKAIVVRGYPGRGADGHLLYRDFFTQLGLTKAEIDGLALSGKDENPGRREDTLELVRMMQNEGLQPDLINEIEQRALHYLEGQRRIIPNMSRDFDAVVARSKAGLDVLNQLPESDVDVALFEEGLPMPMSDRVAEHAEIKGALINEINALRTQMETRMDALSDRLGALEHGKKPALRRRPSDS